MWVILLIIINLIHSFTLSRRYSRVLQKNIELLTKKKEELEEVLDNADIMINELNNISNYVVSKVEETHQLFTSTMEQLNGQIKEGEELINRLNDQFLVHHKEELLNDSSKVKESSKQETEHYESVNDMEQIDEIDEHLIEQFTIRSKSKTALKMAHDGMSIREIAKKLNTGQGEIELLLGLKK